MPLDFERSISKLKVTGVKSLIIGWSTITRVVLSIFTLNLAGTSYVYRSRTLLMGDLESESSRSRWVIKVEKIV